MNHIDHTLDTSCHESDLNEKTFLCHNSCGRLPHIDHLVDNSLTYHAYQKQNNSLGHFDLVSDKHNTYPQSFQENPIFHDPRKRSIHNPHHDLSSCQLNPRSSFQVKLLDPRRQEPELWFSNTNRQSKLGTSSKKFFGGLPVPVEVVCESPNEMKHRSSKFVFAQLAALRSRDNPQIYPPSITTGYKANIPGRISHPIRQQKSTNDHELSMRLARHNPGISGSTMSTLERRNPKLKRALLPELEEDSSPRNSPIPISPSSAEVSRSVRWLGK